MAGTKLNNALAADDEARYNPSEYAFWLIVTLPREKQNVSENVKHKLTNVNSLKGSPDALFSTLCFNFVLLL